MAKIEYRKGPIGWAVSVDGEPVGRLVDQRKTAVGGWRSSIAGMTTSGVGTGSLHHRTLDGAKTAVERHFEATTQAPEPTR